jgi:hypothetical protein
MGRNLKISLIIGGIVLGLGAVLAFVFWSGNFSRQPTVRPLRTADRKVGSPSAASSSPAEISRSRPTNIISRANEIYQAAKEQKNGRQCLEIKDKEIRLSCLRALALSENDLSACRLMEDEQAKEECLNEVKFRQAVEKKDILACQDLGERDFYICAQKIVEKSDNIPIEICQRLPTAAEADLPGRQKRGKRKVCQSLILLKEAKAKKSADLCNQIPLSAEKGICLGAVLGIPLADDADNDGLSYWEEVMYGTDPAKPDTDGDGYSDKEEVEAGYNPLGEGKGW